MYPLHFNGWQQLPPHNDTGIVTETDKAVGAAAYQGNIHLFTKGRTGADQNKIFERIKRGDTWSSRREVEGGGRTDAGLAAVVLGSDLFLFVKGTGGQIFFNRKRGTDAPWQAGWTAIAGLSSDAAPAAAVYRGQIHFYAKRAEGNEVFTCRFPEPSAFSAWGEVGGGGRVSTGLGVTTFEDYVTGEPESLFLFGVGFDRRIYINKWQPLENRWSGWHEPYDLRLATVVGGTTNAPVTGAWVARPGTPDSRYRYIAMFAKGIDNPAVFVNVRGYDVPDWTGFFPLNERYADAGQVIDAVTPVVLNNQMHLYGVGTRFGVFENIQQPLSPR